MSHQQLQGHPSQIQYAAMPGHAEAPTTEKFPPPSYGPQEVMMPPNATMPMYATAIPVQSYQDELLARCRAGDHSPSRKYGVCGIVTAVLCFPIGLICLFTDSKKVCMRCKEIIG